METQRRFGLLGLHFLEYRFSMDTLSQLYPIFRTLTANKSHTQSKYQRTKPSVSVPVLRSYVDFSLCVRT